MIREALTIPDTLILRRLDQRGYKLETISILLLGLLGSVGFGYVGYQINNALEARPGRIEFQLIGQALEPVFMLVALWLVYTVLSHFLANLYQGRGPISRLFRTTAWAMLPVALWLVIRGIVVIGLFWGVDFPGDPSGLTAEAKVEEILYGTGEYADGTPYNWDGLSSWVYSLTLVTGTLFAAWSGYHLSNAIQEAKGVAQENARKIAAVPAGLWALYLLWSAVTNLGVL